MAQGKKASLSSLRDWYADGLGSKVERAVTDGRVDAAQAAEFHRLMEQLLEADSRQPAGVGRVLRMDGRAVR